MSFWNNLPRPFFVMAPMKDVTDAAFRALIAKCWKPDVSWTEFVSADGLYHSVPSLLRDLQFSSEEHPIVAQIFSSKPEMISYATKLVAKLGFDGVDLNMGCPDKSIEKQGAGASLMKNPKLAVELIHAAQDAARDIPKQTYRSDLVFPVSVKTRIGYNKESLDEWLTVLLEANPAVITIHLRTRKEQSLAPAHWELMKKAVEIRNRVNPNVLLIGNGDVKDLDDAMAKAEESGCDGVMLGRAMFGNPWVFSGRKNEDTPLAEKLAALVELAHNFEKINPPKDFSLLKKHIKAFVTGFSGAVDLRAKLMKAENVYELASAVRLYT